MSQRPETVLIIFLFSIFFVGVDPKGTFKTHIPVADVLLNIALYLADAGEKAWNGEAGKSFIYFKCLLNNTVYHQDHLIPVTVD